MKNLCFTIVITLLLLIGCGKTTEMQSSEEVIDITNSPIYEPEPENAVENGEVEEVEFIPQHDWSCEEMDLLSIDFDRLVLYIGLDGKKEPYDALSALKEKYPDLEIISTINTGRRDRHETWFSKSTGLSYSVYHWEGKTSEEWYSLVQRISGHTEDIITGLRAPIDIEKFMAAPSMADAEWVVGEGPESVRFKGYYLKEAFEKFFTINENDLCILIPIKPYPDWYEQVVGIWINVSTPGFISPTDEIEITAVGISD